MGYSAVTGSALMYPRVNEAGVGKPTPPSRALDLALAPSRPDVYSERAAGLTKGGTKMKRLSVALLVMCASLLPTKALAEPAVTTNVPFTYSGQNPCVAPPEAFVGTGTMHFLVSGNLSEGGMAYSHLQANLQGLKAVTISGKKYVVVSSESQTFVLDTSDAAPFVVTWVQTVNYVRVGEDGTIIGGDDFHLHFRIHTTVNANGVPTVDRFTIEEFCR